MLRLLALAGTAYFVWASPDLTTVIPSPELSSLLREHKSTIQTLLKSALAVWLLFEVNGVLSRWAENRWMWKRDTSMCRMEDEIAVVTGGSRGIGAAVVQQLTALGTKVAVLDLAPLCDELKKYENNLVFYYKCDITSPDAVHQAGEAIRSDIGPPSILINNAGIGNANSILEIPQERLNAIFQVNLLSHWITVKEFLPGMLAKKKGHIMGVASLASFVGLAGMVDYSATKAGVLAFHEGLTQELKHRYKCPQIKTTIVHPYWTRTAMTEQIEQGIRSSGASLVDPSHVAKVMVKQITSNRSGQIVFGPRGSPYVRAFPTWMQEMIRDKQAEVVTVNGTTSTAVA